MATTPADVTVIGGVDTHERTHDAAVIETGTDPWPSGVPAAATGDIELLAWMRSVGDIASIGVESTQSFGTTQTASTPIRSPRPSTTVALAVGLGGDLPP